MPRRPRIEVADGIHHVWGRGNRREAIFSDDVDRTTYLLQLATVVDRMEWNCISYCLMDNHVHLLLETPQPNLGRGMQRLHGSYGRDFNRRLGHVGHVFQGPYGARLVEDDTQLVMAAMYIALNPVAAGLCQRAQDWPWSSHAALLAGEEPGWLRPKRLFEVLAAAGGDPRRRYRELVDEGD